MIPNTPEEFHQAYPLASRHVSVILDAVKEEMSDHGYDEWAYHGVQTSRDEIMHVEILEEKIKRLEAINQNYFEFANQIRRIRETTPSLSKLYNMAYDAMNYQP